MRKLLGWGVLVAVALGSGCAVDPRTRVKLLEEEQRRLTQAVRAADQSIEAASAYTAELGAPGQSGSNFSLYFTPAMLEQLSRQTLPYRMSGREFHSQLTGEIIVERLSDFRMLSRNRLRCRAHLRGVGVRYTGKVPAFAKGQVKEFQKSIEGGAVADLEVQLSLEGNLLRAKAEAMSVQMVTKRDGSAEGMLRDEMNKRALRTPVVFDMAVGGSSAAPRRVMVTGNHVIVTYAP